MTLPDGKSRIAVFAGPVATILNSPELRSSQAVREALGGAPPDALRAQRLAAPVTVFVERFSAHPLEADAADLYGHPDGYIDDHGNVSSTPRSRADRAVYRVDLRPEDGLYLLPYVARRRGTSPTSLFGDREPDAITPEAESRLTFYPDAARVYEEIDRFGLDDAGRAGLLSSLADFDFYRPAPPGGFRAGRPDGWQPAGGSSDALERAGVDFFPYYPHEGHDPSPRVIAHVTNQVAEILRSDRYDGAQWLEGSPTIEDTL